MTTLPVSEVFGPTWQGEGRLAGQLCGFVRLGLCNLACEWCDTPYTWDRTRYDVKAECPDTPVRDVIHRVNDLDVPLMVLSGGEPLIHANTIALETLVRMTSLAGVDWAVETNGTFTAPPWMCGKVRHWTVSPKVSTGGPLKRRLKPDVLRWWAHRARMVGDADFKFVATGLDDLYAVDELVTRFQLPRDHVWVMPEGVKPNHVLGTHRLLAEHILERRYHTTTRLQTLLWADERGH